MDRKPPFTVVENKPDVEITHEDASLAVEKLQNYAFAANHVMQDYAVNSPEHRSACALIADMQAPLCVLREYFSGVGFLPVQPHTPD